MGRPRILLADDNPEMLQRVANFPAPDFDVVGSVADGQEALDSALRLIPDILVTDISMPVLNGIQVASGLKRSSSTVRVIFLTSTKIMTTWKLPFRSGRLAMSSSLALPVICLWQ